VERDDSRKAAKTLRGERLLSSLSVLAALRELSFSAKNGAVAIFIDPPDENLEAQLKKY
jgi:hypothetical protein